MINFTFFPENKYSFKTKLKSGEIINTLTDNCLLSEGTGMQITNKPFIGQINNDGFKIISSQFPIGPICVIYGKIFEKEITEIFIEVKLNRTFKNLFYFWLITMIGLIFAFKASSNQLITQISLLILLILSFRFFIFKIIFKKIAQIGIQKLEYIINLERNN